MAAYTYITPTVTSTTLTSGSVQIWTAATTTSTFDSSNKEYCGLPTVWEAIARFLEYDDSELLVSDEVSKDGQPFVKITDDDLIMHIMFNELSDKFYFTMSPQGSEDIMPQRMNNMNLEDILTNEDAFNTAALQLLSRLKMFESMFA